MKGKVHQFRGDREYSSAQEVEGKKGQPAEGSEPWSVQSCPLLSFPIDLSSLIPLTRCRPYPEINYPPRAHTQDNLQIVHSWSIFHSQRIAGTIQRRNPQLPRAPPCFRSCLYQISSNAYLSCPFVIFPRAMDLSMQNLPVVSSRYSESSSEWLLNE